MSDNALIEKMLNLPEFRVTDFKHNDNNMVFEVETKERPKVCPKCGVYKANMVIYKTPKERQIIRDINNQGKRVALRLLRHHYHCKECGAHFPEPLQSVYEHGRITIRLRHHIAEIAAPTPFVDIERDYDLSDTLIGEIFLERVRKIPTVSQMVTPRVLGIDEIYLISKHGGRKEAWCVVGNIEEGTVMDMMEDRTKPYVTGMLRSLQTPRNVEVVTMDMHSGYRSAVYETLPNALVVIDKFHIVKMVNDQMDFVRRVHCRTAPYQLKKDQKLFLKRRHKLTPRSKAFVDMWLMEYPVMLKTYQLKEDFYHLYECPTRAAAERYYEDWQKSIPAGTDYNGFRMIVETIRRCKKEVFNYFDEPYTNGFIEGVNSAIRAISMQGRGYSFEILRGKVLLTVGRRREVVKTDFDNCTFTTFNPRIQLPKVRDYGVPLDAILRAIEAGAYR